MNEYDILFSFEGTGDHNGYYVFITLSCRCIMFYVYLPCLYCFITFESSFIGNIKVCKNTPMNIRKSFRR